MESLKPIPANNRRILMRWLVGGVLVTLLMSISSAWQSWERNESLAALTSLPVYFMVIWVSFLLWIPIALLIYQQHRRYPMFSKQQPRWWLIHLGLSVVVCCLHLLIDTFLLWASLSGSFSFWAGYLEKLIRWLPYDLLGYWACLALMTLVSHRKRILTPDASNQNQHLERLSLKINDETHFIPVDQIDYIEACDNYVQIWRGQNTQLIKQTMASLEKRLNPQQFMRIHRSFIVNLNAVDRITKNANQHPAIIMKHGRPLPISRRRRASLKQVLLNR